MPDSQPLALTPLNRVLCPPLNLVPPNTPPHLFDAAVAHFTSIPWCATLLGVSASSSLQESSRVCDGAAIPFIPQCFNPLSDRHDQLVGVTLGQNPHALRHMLCFFRPDDENHLTDPERPIARVSALFALGDGLSGYEGVLHGGMAATLMDETFGAINELNTALSKAGPLYSASSVTASLDISFRRPIPDQGNICITAWVESITGRKTVMSCELTGADGKVLTSAKSTWIALKSKM
ncbi:hypothetical protein HIM_08331 [Hirsutella minnesotensis 3608]|uniref:Acyl-coenzyme A thioesterase THEM4 n=1 Tax=Hirsutella minnesotensis 3608 TaxID=1043627 RepID=A0A0F7ZMN1_9HYPO|nr:hypothetical protein HIM_08331 [Hirsutella minnesotensis 3608]